MIAAVTVVGAASPQQPAAPAGKEVCAGCHGQVVAQFDRSADSAVALKEGGPGLARQAAGPALPGLPPADPDEADGAIVVTRSAGVYRG